jgi:S1-C subfamily serine protease
MILRLIIFSVVAFGFFSPIAHAGLFTTLARELSKLADDGAKSAPKQADELAVPKGGSNTNNSSAVEDLLLVTRTLSKGSHNRSCPSMSLRVSLPQLNAQLTIPKDLNIRSGPSTNYERQAKFRGADTYTVDLLDSNRCFIKIRYPADGRHNEGWVSAKHVVFEFDNHLNMPRQNLVHQLDPAGVYSLVAKSTYKIEVPGASGSAVAISPTVLLTNCHVLGNFDSVEIIDSGTKYLARLMHDDHSLDKCFIRSLYLEVDPVPNILSFNKIRRGERVYTIGAPGGVNRTIDEGKVLDKQDQSDQQTIDASAQVDFGSSGGGLFDAYGNLLGITTWKFSYDRKRKNLSRSIAAEDFWR